MNRKVSQLGEDKPGQTSYNLQTAPSRLCIERMVDVVSHERSKPPIVRTVFKQVSNRHCRVTEAMNEQRLQNPFDIMSTVTDRRVVDN